MTTDENTKGYGSNFVVMEESPEKIWGFHLVWLNIGGRTASSTAAMRIRLGRYTIQDYGVAFLRTFNSVLARTVGAEHVLGMVDQFDSHPELSTHHVIDMLLVGTYKKMWDLDVDTVPFEDVTPAIIVDFKAFVLQEFKETVD